MVAVAASPAVNVLGEIAVTVGTRFCAVRVRLALVPPPGVGLTTRMKYKPALVTRLGGTTAVRVVPLTYVVTKFVVSSRATEAASNPDPVSVIVAGGAFNGNVAGATVKRIGDG